MGECKILAIIIPAYKKKYLRFALKSILNQTNKNFNLYIGDDNSPEDLWDVVKDFSTQLSITYNKFDTNLGGKNLVSHWNRCLDMMRGEKYFCLFSDDDEMEPECVENFYKEIENNNKYDVYHYNIKIINSNNDVVNKPVEFPEVIGSEEFFANLFRFKIDARMPEFIFETKHFRELNGFVNFDLAWRSDSATEMLMALDKGIKTISNSYVRWRMSEINISAVQDRSISDRKDKSTIDFFNWADATLKSHSLSYGIGKKSLIHMYSSNMCSTFYRLGKTYYYNQAFQFDIIKSNKDAIWYVLCVYYRKLRRNIKKHFSK